MTHEETLELLRARDLTGRRVRCFGDPALAVLDTGRDTGRGAGSGSPSADGYDVAVVATGWAGLPEATKAVRALVDGLAADGVVVTSVAHPCVAPPVSTWAAYSGDPVEAAYAGDALHGPAYRESLAAHAAEFEGLGLRTQVVHLREVTLVVATRLAADPPAAR